MKKVPVSLALNFAVAVIATFVVGIAAGVIFAAATIGWLYAWRRSLLSPQILFRALIVQFAVFNTLTLWLWSRPV